MNTLLPAPLRDLPWKVMGLLFAIALFGGVVLYSAAGGSVSPWALTHMVRFCVFLVMALVISRVPIKVFQQIAFPLFGAVTLLLMAVELLGAVKGGSQRWLDLGFIRLQPSELMKPAVVLVLARFYDMLPVGATRSWSAIWPASLLMGVPAALVLLQPDLGTTLAILGGGITVMFLAGLPMRLFVGGGLAMLIIAPLAYFFGLHDYQRKRVLIFLDPEADPLGAGYHISQSKIAIGSGGVFGKGFLNGSQSHLDYLPEGHTDFVFATMAEEWGLLGGLLVIFGFFLLLKWAWGVAVDSPSRFGKLLSGGLAMTIFLYIAINLMMVMGMAPVVGIPLPFLSHGGSAMMTVMMCIGMLMAMERQKGRSGSLLS